MITSCLKSRTYGCPTQSRSITGQALMPSMQLGLLKILEQTVLLLMLAHCVQLWYCTCNITFIAELDSKTWKQQLKQLPILHHYRMLRITKLSITLSMYDIYAYYPQGVEETVQFPNKTTTKICKEVKIQNNGSKLQKR